MARGGRDPLWRWKRPPHGGWTNGAWTALTLRAAGFTNFTQDHLDYHQTMAAYFAAKALLFLNAFCPMMVSPF